MDRERVKYVIFISIKKFISEEIQKVLNTQQLIEMLEASLLVLKKQEEVAEEAINGDLLSFAKKMKELRERNEENSTTQSTRTNKQQEDKANTKN